MKKVTAFIFYPLIGAVIGAVLFQSVFTLITTKKLKLWQKVGIAGAVWGLPFTGIALAYILRFPLYVLGIANLEPTTSELKLLAFPSFIAVKLLQLHYPKSYWCCDAWAGFGMLIIEIPTSILIGALIGGGLGFIYQKLKESKGGGK